VLHEYLRLTRGVKRPRDGFSLRAESFFNVATEIENLDAEPSFGPTVIDSYGERYTNSHMVSLSWRCYSNGLAGKAFTFWTSRKRHSRLSGSLPFCHACMT
jgi:predicted ATPase